jgi:nucleotide-binding universal stress UspA family protein
VTAGATRGLTRSIRQLRPALVVVGARGPSIRDAFVGSTAERLAGFGRRPVLLVRRPARREYRDVVIGADAGSAVADAVAAAQLVAPDARRSVLHAYEGPFEYRLLLNGANAAEMRRYRAQTRREARAEMSAVLREAGVDEALLRLQHGRAPRVLQHVDANALLVINRHHSLTRHLLLGSTTRFVIGHGRSDVLIV